MNCLNLNLAIQYQGKEATVGDVLNDLTKILGDKDVAYAVLTENNGYPINLTKTGAESEVYSKLLDAFDDTGIAANLKARLHSQDFKNEFGDWLATPEIYSTDTQGEPKLIIENGNYFYIDKLGNRIVAIPGNDLSDLGIVTSAKPIKTIRQSKSLNTSKVESKVVKKNYGDLKQLPVYSKEGVNTMRKYKTYKHFGNPWTGSAIKGAIQVAGKVGENTTKERAALMYFNWLTTNKHNDINPLQRNWILSEIEKGKLNNKTLLYMSSQGYKSHADALLEVVKKLQSKATAGVIVPQGETATVAGFMAANELLNIPVNDTANEQETEATYNYIVTQAQLLGIEINPNKVKMKEFSTFSNDREGSKGTITLGTGLDRYSKPIQARIILNAILGAITAKRVNGMSTSEGEEYSDNLNSFVNNYVSSDPKVTEALKLIAIEGIKNLVENVFHNKALAQTISKDSIAEWENLATSVLDALPKEHRNESMLSILSANILQMHATDEAIIPLQPASIKSGHELNTQERDDILKKQFRVDKGGELKIGSIAKFSKAGKGTQNVVIIRIDKNKKTNQLVYTGLKYDFAYLSKKGRTTVFTGENRHFSKDGDFHIMESPKKGNKSLISVFPGNFVINYTKAGKRQAFVDTENEEDMSDFRELALAYGQVKKKITVKKNIAYKSSGLYYALTNPTITKPRGGTWGAADMAKRDDQTKEWYTLFKVRKFKYKGVEYQDTEDAYQSLKTKYPITKMVKVNGPNNTHRTISNRDAFMEDLLIEKFKQYPELYEAIRLEMGDTATDVFFSTLEHNVAGNDAHWSSAGNNGFIKALHHAYLLIDSSTPLGDNVLETKEAKEEMSSRISASVAFKTDNAESSTRVIEAITKLLDINIEGAYTIEKAEAVLNLYAGSSAYQSIEEYVVDGTTETEKVVMYNAVLDILGDKRKIKKTPEFKENKKKYPSNTPVPFDLDGSTVEEKISELSIAVDDRVKVFKTFTKEDAEAFGESGIEQVVDYLISKGYSTRINPEEGIRELHKIADTVEPTIIHAPIIKEDIKVAPKNFRIDFSIKTLPKSDSREYVTIRNEEGKVVEFRINPHILSPATFINLAKQAARSNFKIDSTSVAMLKFVMRLKQENGGMPANLYVTAKLRDAMIAKSNQLATKVTKTGEVVVGNETIVLSDVNIPFDLTNDQTVALNKLANWLNTSSSKPFLIEGNAGTGKTTLLRVAHHYVNNLLGRKTSFTALTNPATVNLEKLIGTAATTVHSLLGIAPGISIDSGRDLDFDELNFDLTQYPPGSVIFIDEIGLAPAVIVNAIYDLLTTNGIKVVMIGSKAQLSAIEKDTDKDNPLKDQPPVDSLVFDKVLNETYTLQEVKRQGELNPASGFLHRLATNQREEFSIDGIKSSNAFYDAEKGEGVLLANSKMDYIAWAQVQFEEAMKEDNPNRFRMMTLSNASANWYNTILRSQLLNTPQYVLNEGEYVFLAEKHLDENGVKGMQYKVTDVSVEVETITPGSELTIPVYRATLKVPEVSNYPDPITGAPALKDIQIRLAVPITTSQEELSEAMAYGSEAELFSEAAKLLDYETRNTIENESNQDPTIKEYGAYIARLRTAAFINKNGADAAVHQKKYLDAMAEVSFMFSVHATSKAGNPYTVVNKNLSYGYASTVNKAMGSTFEIIGGDVAAAESFFGRRKKNANRERAVESFNQYTYTVASRASKLSVLLIRDKKLKDTTANESITIRQEIDKNNLTRQSKKLNTKVKKVFESTPYLSTNVYSALGFSEDIDSRNLAQRNLKYAAQSKMMTNKRDSFANGRGFSETERELRSLNTPIAETTADIIEVEQINIRAKEFDTRTEEGKLASQEEYDKKNVLLEKIFKQYQENGWEVKYEKSGIPGIAHTLFFTLPNTDIQVSYHGNYENISQEDLDSLPKGKWDGIPGAVFHKLEEASLNILNEKSTDTTNWRKGIDLGINFSQEKFIPTEQEKLQGEQAYNNYRELNSKEIPGSRQDIQAFKDYLAQEEEGTELKIATEKERTKKQSKRIVKPNGKRVIANSMEDNMSNILVATNSKAKITSISEVADNMALESLMEANPEGILVTDPSNKTIVRLNAKLLTEIAVNKNDPRAQELGLDTYNKMVYDSYINAVYDVLKSTLSNENLTNNKNVNLQLKHLAARKKLSKEKVDLVQELNTKRQDPTVAEEELEGLRQDIKRKEEFIDKVQKHVDLEDITNMSLEDAEVIEEILSRPSIDTASYNRARRIIDTWEHAGVMQDRDKHTFMTEDEMNVESFRDLFRDIAKKFNEYSAKLDKLGRNLIVNDSSKTTGLKLTYNAILKLRNKIGGFAKNFLAITKVDNPIIAHIFNLISDSNQRKDIEAISESKTNGTLIQKLKDKAYDLSIFWEKTKKGIVSGNLISEYSYEYNKLRKQRFFGKYVFKKYKEATVILETNRLDTEADREEYIQELTAVMSEEKARASVAEALEKYEEYKKFRDSHMLAAFGIKFEDKNTLSEEDTKKLHDWEYINSPHWRRYQYEEAVSPEELENDKLAERFMVAVPKSIDETTLKPTEWYSESYKTLHKDQDAADYYKFASGITKRAKENFNEENMSDYALGAIAKSLTDQFLESGVSKVTAQSSLDTFLDPFTGGYDVEEKIDPITGKEIKYVKKGIITLEGAINKRVSELKFEKYPNKKWDMKIALDRQRMESLYEEASIEIMKGNSHDIAMAINNLNLASIGYKYKQEVKPKVEMAMYYLDKMEAGEQRSDYARKIDEGDVSNAKAMTEHFVNKELYDEGAPDTTYKLPFRILSSEQKEKKKVLTDKIKLLEGDKFITEVDRKNLAIYKKELKAIGGYVTVGSILDRAMSLLRTATMGWNFYSAFANLLQGQTANLVMAASGVHYDYSELREGTAKLLTDNKKFSNAVNNYALLGDIMYNMSNETKFRGKKGIKSVIKQIVDPFMGTKVTEKANQGAVMIAMMLRMKVKTKDSEGNLISALDKNGKELSMWEALSEDGILADNFYYDGAQGVHGIAKAVQLIREQVAAIHGDYINSKMIQDAPEGRAFTMFKMWFFDPLMARVGTHRYNYTLKKETKGRYLTLVERLFENRLNLNKYYTDYKEGNLSEIDTENMRVNFAEAIAIVTLLIVQNLVGKLLCGDEEEESECTGISAYIVNLIRRWFQETATFVSPKGWYDFAKNPFAVSRYLRQISRIMELTVDAATGEDITNDEGRNKILDILMKETPLIRRIEMEQEMAEKLQNYN